MDKTTGKTTLDQTQSFWRSLEEVSQDPNLKEILKSEFPSTPIGNDEGASEVDRRGFLKLMGASMALTSMSCIRKPVQKIVPYANRPVEIEPGKPNYYTSSYFQDGEGYSVIVKTREGRPIYLTSNSDNPLSPAGMTIRGHAHVLNLYDPDRIKGPQKSNRQGEATASTWDLLDEAVLASLNKGGVRVLSSSIGSPSTRAILADFFQAFGGKLVEWDAVSYEDVLAGQEASYGTRVVPRFLYDKAKLIVSVGADFLGTWISPAKNSELFANGRKPGAEMNKLVVFESLLSLTGSNADSRLKVKPSQYLDVVLGLAHEIVVVGGRSSFAGQSQVKSALDPYANTAQALGVDPALFKQIANDLWENRGKSLVVSGGLSAFTPNANSLQVATNFLNSLLSNEGATVDGTGHPYVSFRGSESDLETLTQEMEKGQVTTLFVHKSNPVYALGEKSRFSKALEKVGTIVYIGETHNETSQMADWIAPAHHAMENWGDIEINKGVFQIQQPTVRPLYDTRSIESNVMNWAYAAEKGPRRILDPESWYDYLRNRWKEYQGQLAAGGDFESFWQSVLEKGYAAKISINNFSARSFKASALSSIEKAASSDVELVLYTKAALGSGDMANNPWLQELPDPVTKVCWDNYLVVSQAQLKKLGLRKSGDHVKVERNGVSEVLPVLEVPGIHDDVVGVAVGYGRTIAGRVGEKIGANVFPLSERKGASLATSGLKVTLTPVGGSTELANTQGHSNLEGRQLVVEATLDQYLANPSANIHKHKIFSIWPKKEYKGHRWAMAIDLNACVGCSACSVACQSENNIPTVGKKYVLEGREMHWIRIDRYFSGDASDPDVIFQPMTCQHCENASCESVCPVIATSHDEEGINQMTYNRCVGTRYCVNNCPYKVRRFNWFNFTDVEKSTAMVFNPDVTVRSRGVMEKCSFCTQRIKYAKHEAVREKRALRDGDIKTACQEACPTNAIVFGDVNNPESLVSQAFKNERTFSVLEELNNVPMVRYQTKLRNKAALKSTGHGKGGH